MSGDATGCAEADDERDALAERHDSKDGDVDDRNPGDGELPSSDPATADPATVQRELRRRAETVRRRERDRALERLEAAGDLTDEQRRAVDVLSSAIADDVVDRTDALLRDAASGDEAGDEAGDEGGDDVGAAGGRSGGEPEADRERRATAAALRELFLSNA